MTVPEPADRHLAEEAIIDSAIDALAAGHASNAVALLEPLVARKPENIEAVHALIRALSDADRPSEALALTQQLIVREPEDVLAHTRLSMLLQRLGDVPAAEAAATRAKLLGWKLELRAASQAEATAKEKEHNST